MMEGTETLHLRDTRHSWVYVQARACCLPVQPALATKVRIKALSVRHSNPHAPTRRPGNGRMHPAWMQVDLLPSVHRSVDTNRPARL